MHGFILVFFSLSRGIEHTDRHSRRHRHTDTDIDTDTDTDTDTDRSESETSPSVQIDKRARRGVAWY